MMSGRILLAVAVLVASMVAALPDQAARADGPAGCISTPEGLVGQWSAEGNAGDSLGWSPGELSTYAGFAPGRVGSAFWFDGVSGHVRVDYTPFIDVATDGLTVEAWIKPDVADSTARIIATTDFGGALTARKYNLYIQGGQLGFLTTTQGGASFVSHLYGSPNEISAGVWTHVAGTYDGTSMRWYINGELEGTAAQSGNIRPRFTPLWIGQFITGDGRFDGLIDELAIYDRGLDGTEIQAIFDAGTAGKCPIPEPPTGPCFAAPADLVGQWKGEADASDVLGISNGSLQNGARIAKGLVGDAFMLDGSDDQIVVSHTSAIDLTGDQLTIEAWIHPAQLKPGVAHIVATTDLDGAPDERKYNLFVQDTAPFDEMAEVGFLVQTNAAADHVVIRAGSVASREWTHVAGVYDGSEIRVYVNGMQVGTPVSVTGNIVQRSTPLYLGRFPNGQGAFPGLIDELSIYERALSSPELEAISLAHAGGKSSDCDGVPGAVEDAGPNGGDANNDGVLDSSQENVASLPNAEDGRYVTLVSPLGTSLRNVVSVSNPSPGDAPTAEYEFPFGFLSFEVGGLEAGSDVDIGLLTPTNAEMDTYWRYGPTPTNTVPHWYQWGFDGSTGAEIVSDSQLTLHFVDGAAGDGDLTADGSITDPGAPAVTLNEPPLADPNGPYVVTEGSTVMLDGTASSDPDDDPLAYSWSPASNLDDPTSATPTYTGVDDAVGALLNLTVTDPDGLSSTEATSVTVENAPPALGTINAPIDPVPVGTSVAVSASYSDPGIADTHTAEWDWGDGTTSAGLVAGTSGEGTVTATHAYDEPGVYTVALTVTDDDGGVGQSDFDFVVVYDPDGGFVTGGGRIESPAGAYTADPDLTGRATFGFVSRYKKGAKVPSGNTEFQFKAGDLDFHSMDYQWLVVTGNDHATFKGTGTINESGEYKFRIWAGDDQPDTFRIKIWTEDELGNETVVYDNVTDQAISGGGVVVHTK